MGWGGVRWDRVRSGSAFNHASFFFFFWGGGVDIRDFPVIKLVPLDPKPFWPETLKAQTLNP